MSEGLVSDPASEISALRAEIERLQLMVDVQEPVRLLSLARGDALWSILAELQCGQANDPILDAERALNVIKARSEERRHLTQKVAALAAQTEEARAKIIAITKLAEERRILLMLLGWAAPPEGWRHDPVKGVVALARCYRVGCVPIQEDGVPGAWVELWLNNKLLRCESYTGVTEAWTVAQEWQACIEQHELIIPKPASKGG